MANLPILSLLIFLPLAGAGFILAINGDDDIGKRNARRVALWTSSVTFLLSLHVWFNFDPSTADFQFVEKVDWIP
ncbi:MAG: NADH-quinone oxidoreductase subunit M, partial [Alphaproteobacteria bacterium]|nr:NADH-quinone oxidoreductase subunit M [Alphaproteobacteria bacterium]